MSKKIIIGTVVSDKMDKTIVVAVKRRVPHHKYGKIQTKTLKFKAHDEGNDAKAGAIVRIIESRPLSREKTWCLVEVLEQPKAV